MAVSVTSVTGVYPMDSLVTGTDADGLPVYDRPYNAGDLRTVMACFLSSGVFADSGEELAVSVRGGSVYVGGGEAMCAGLYVPSAGERRACDVSDIPTGSYAYAYLQARFDSGYRDAAIGVRLSAEPSAAPVRTESTFELLLARVDWRGEVRDLRADAAMCGFVTPFEQVDTESFLLELRTRASQFDLRVGTVTALPSGTTPTVTVRRPDAAGEAVVIDYGIPRGAKGEPGRDGDMVPSVWLQAKEPPASAGAVWLVDSDAHEITAIRGYEVTGLWPSSATYPGPDTYPGGTGRWVDHALAASLVGGA